MSHAALTAQALGMVGEAGSTNLFSSGGRAVDFFFTLSGFLITYLLLVEHEQTGTVSLKSFYLRRVRRIWPLYFVILVLGFVIFALVYPRIYHARYFDFPLIQGFLLYVFFLPNVMRSFYHVGLLFPLWSIGVEEQFYLCWAPLAKYCYKALFVIAATITLILAMVHAFLPLLSRAAPTSVLDLVGTLRFHYMGVGALIAIALFRDPQRLLNSWITSYWFQVVTVGVLLSRIIFRTPIPESPFDLVIAFLSAALILNVSVSPKRWIRLDWQPLEYLGRISYGIYMYQLAVDYVLRTAAGRFQVFTHPSVSMSLLYGAMLLALTVLVSHLSFRFLESPIISMGRNKQSRTAAAGRPLREAIS